MKTLRDFNVKNKRILVRSDFNVPLEENGNILDDFRIRQSLSTIKYLIKKGAKIILISHLGRPLEKSSNPKFQKYSLKPIALRLEKLLKRKVRFLNDCIGKKVENEVKEMRSGELILLENLRLYKEEEECDLKFAKNLAKLGQIFINDAFGVCHRLHASVTGIPKFLPSGVGFLIEKELKNLDKIIKNPKLPLIAVIGGTKVETKAGVINKISEFADFILVGHLIFKELNEKKILLKHPQKIIGPINKKEIKSIPYDIGTKTISLFKEKIEKAKTIFWSGPLGKIEEEKFQKGSKEIARAIVESKAFSVAGGGETVEFLNKIKITKKFDYISTGGGAMLSYLSGNKLPGLEAIDKQ